MAKRSAVAMAAIGLGLAALVWWLWPRATRVDTLLPQTTVSVVHLTAPNAVAQRLEAIIDGLDGQLGSLTRWLGKPERAHTVGFDVNQGFGTIGLGPQGALIARLTRIEPGVLCLDLADRARFTTWLAARAQQPVEFGPAHLKVGPKTLPVLTDDAWTCLTREDVTPDQLAAAFEANERLTDSELWQALNTRKAPSHAGWSARNATRWAHARKRTALAGDLGHLAAYVHDATAHLDANLHLAVHFTPEGERLADQLFNPSAPPDFNRWLARPGWAAARLSLALPTAPEALATALPPSAPAAQRQGIALGRMALPMTAGISWTQLIEALSGHVAMGFDVRVTGPKPPSMLCLGVKDPKAAAKALAAVAKKFSEGGGLFGMGSAKPETIAGKSVWKLTFKTGPAWAHLDGDVIVVVSDPALLTQPAKPTPNWHAINAADVVLAVAGDLKAIGARLPEGAPIKDWPEQGALAIQRGAPGLTLTTGNGISVEALVQLGIWLRGRRP